MTEHVCEWRWTDVHRSHLVTEMKWKCVHCPAVLSIAKAENRINATESLSVEDARGAIPQQINKRMADALQAYADMLEGK